MFRYLYMTCIIIGKVQNADVVIQRKDSVITAEFYTEGNFYDDNN